MLHLSILVLIKFIILFQSRSPAAREDHSPGPADINIPSSFGKINTLQNTSLLKCEKLVLLEKMKHLYHNQYYLKYA